MYKYTYRTYVSRHKLAYRGHRRGRHLSRGHQRYTRKHTIAISAALDEEVTYDKTENEQIQQKINTLAKVDAFAIAGTVVSTAAVVTIGVAEAPVLVLALPVTLPLIALIAAREKASLRRKQLESQQAQLIREELQRLRSELDIKLSESVKMALNPSIPTLLTNFDTLQSKISSLEGSILGATRMAFDTAKQLDNSRQKLVADSDLIAEASISKFNEKIADIKPSINEANELLLDSVREVVRQEVASEESRIREIETSLSDIKKDLHDQALLQSDLIDDAVSSISKNFFESEDSSHQKLMQALNMSASVQNSLQLPGRLSAESYGAEEDCLGTKSEFWLRSELKTVEDSIANTLENIIENYSMKDASNYSGDQDVMAKRIDLFSDKLERSLSDMQGYIESISKDSPIESKVDDLRSEIFSLSESMTNFSKSLEIVENLEMTSLKSLPSLVEGLAYEVKSTLRQYEVEVSTFQGAVAKFSSKDQKSYMSVPGDNTVDLEQKIDDLASATRVFKGLENQIEELNMQLRVLPDVLTPNVSRDSEDLPINKWLEYEEQEVEDALPVEIKEKSSKVESSPEFSIEDNAEHEESTAKEFENKEDTIQANERFEEQLLSAGIEEKDVVAERNLEASLQTGLKLLREGREYSQNSETFTLAESSFRQAILCFKEVVQADPQCIAAYGNQGNVLLAYARLKMRLSDALLTATDDVTNRERDSVFEEITKETSDMLIEAGRCFRTVLMINKRDVRALLNWGNAICLRAKIIEERDYEGAYNLYDAAIEKFDAALKLGPGTLELLRAMGTSLYDISKLESGKQKVKTLQMSLNMLEEAYNQAPDDENIYKLYNSCRNELEKNMF